MHRRVVPVITAVLLAVGLVSGTATAQTFNSGSTGVDGALSPTTSTTLLLPPDGIFNFTTISIPAGVTVRFTRNAANTPVTLLASGDVTIAGLIDMSGGPGVGGSFGTIVGPTAGLGGPGGFDGGFGGGALTTVAGAGLGPGGGAGGTWTSATGSNRGGGGGFGTAGTSDVPGLGGPVYGTPSLVPLIGGSGGGGAGASLGATGGGGGGGGGAILVASSGTITLTGAIVARGGDGQGFATFTFHPGGGGSGGAVRLVATTVTGSGSVDVRGGSSNGFAEGGVGRLRVEAFTNTATINAAPGAGSIATPAPVALASGPSLRITAVGGVPAPASPSGSLLGADVVLPSATTNPVTVSLAGTNIPLGTTIAVTVKGAVGSATTVTSTGLVGTLASSTAEATVTIPTDQPSVISASTTFTLTASGDAGPVFAAGDHVDRARVTAPSGGAPPLFVVTAPEREVALAPWR